MQKQVQYKQITGTKQACVVLELATSTSKEAITDALHNLRRHPDKAVDGPSAHQAVYLASALHTLEQQMVLLKAKYDSPHTLCYGVIDSKFVLAVTVSAHGSYIRNVCRMLLDKFFIKSMSQLRTRMKSMCPDVYNLYSKDQIEFSLKTMLRAPKLLISSRQPEEQLQGALEKIQETLQTKETAEEGTDPVKHGVEPTMTFAYNIRQVSDLVHHTFIATLNLLGVPFRVAKDKVFIQPGKMQPKAVEYSKKFIKDRLAILDKSTRKDYKSLSTYQQQKETQQRYKERLDLTLTKKILALVQTLATTAVVSSSQHDKLFKDAKNADYEQVGHYVEQLFDFVRQV